MMPVLRITYNYILLPLFIAIIWFASLFNDKIRRGLKARKNLNHSIRDSISRLPKDKKRIWFHSSSMGEFEQAKPIIERLKQESDIQIIVSFFSPSGYENSKNYSFADFVTYIPLDTKQKCKSFLKEIQVDAAVFMRYDIWPNMIYELSEQSTPILLVDATMRYNSPRKYGIAKVFHHHLYSKIDRILTVSKDDLKNFLVFNLDESKLKTVGDTRFDRVYQKSIHAKDKKLFRDEFFKDQKVLVIGSAWEADEEVLLTPLFKLMKIHPEFRVIIAPH
jgi:3-deoxy-D-manno-octulosonic-acid transferase